MVITRGMLIEKLADKSGYYKKDILNVLQCLDDVVLECFGEVTDEEDVAIQLVIGCKIGCSIMPLRSRYDPRTQEQIICQPTCKPNVKFSKYFRETIQKQYDDKKNG